MNALTCCGETSTPDQLPCMDHSCTEPGLPPNAILTERNRFFTGKFMTARDFHDEQAYFITRHRLHHWTLHGWGIVCGLEIEPHPNPNCAVQGWYVVTPGMALDPYGRELIVTEPTPIHLPRLFHSNVPCGRECKHQHKIDNEWWPIAPLPLGESVLIGLQYGEHGVEPVPVLYDDRDCMDQTTPNRLREQPCFRFKPYNPDEGCWLPRCPSHPINPMLNGGDAQGSCHKPRHDCFAPPCPCGPTGFVPLRRLTLTNHASGYQLQECDDTGRRYVYGPLHPYTLTHICQVNWKHGGKTRFDSLLASGAGGHHGQVMRLTIQFDGELCRDLPATDTPLPMGFYRRFFHVGYLNEHGQVLPLPGHMHIHLAPDRRALHCDIDTSCQGHIRAHVNDPIIHIRLNCDFLPDCKGRAVDGNHLRGDLAYPGRCTGDGVEGGVFESWFQLDW